MTYKTITLDCTEGTTEFDAAVNEALSTGWSLTGNLVQLACTDTRYRGGYRVTYTRELVKDSRNEHDKIYGTEHSEPKKKKG